MQAIYYKNLSDERYVNKRINELGRSTNFYFKDDTNITHPTFKVSDSNISEGCNYLYVSDVNRYYFIRNKIYSKQCIYLECDVDVLMSFKSNILKQKCLIKRNEYLFNLYQNDEKMKLYSYEAVRTVQFPGGFNLNTQQFVMGVVGSQIFEDE